MKHLILAALAGAVALAGPAFAQDMAAPPAGSPPPGGGMGRGPGGGMGARMLAMADANGDGVVTRDEYMAAVDARFAREDRNGDGVISPDERPRWNRGPGGPGGQGAPGGDAPTPPPPGGPMARGPMTRDQYRQMATRRFQAWDVNGDGRIDGAEMQSAMAATHRGPGGPGGRMAPPPGDGQ